MPNDYLHEPRVAYFSMEIALRSEIPTYSGGLGVLAGDTLRSGADLELPMVAVSLVSRAGYFKQEINSQGWQIEHPDPWVPSRWAVPLEANIVVNIENRAVWVGGWLYVIEGNRGGRAPVILLDTDLDQNRPEDREITSYLYGGDQVYRLKQEIVLGIGGVRMLQALGFKIRQYHMNEGHSALLSLELLRRLAHSQEELIKGESPYDIPEVRELCNFTTHTPVDAGHDQFPYDLVQRVLGDFIDVKEIKMLAGEERLNMTRLALNLSEYVNGVAKRNAEVSRQAFPGYRFHAVTNGVHPFTWTCKSMARVYDAYLPGWCHEAELLVRVDQIPDQEIWNAHLQAKKELIERVKRIGGMNLDLEKPILGFARRMTAYKRPDLLFHDLERLKKIATQFPFQILLAGKSHPQDEEGKRLIAVLHNHIRELRDQIPMFYFQNYDLEIALMMVSGADVWLNTPQPPLEASGTSGMKAAFNGVPQLSVLDGWWVEGCIEGVNGWGVGPPTGSADGGDAGLLYEKLEQKMLPLYYKNRDGWIEVMKGAIGKNASFFNSHRMLRRYATEAYIR